MFALSDTWVHFGGKPALRGISCRIEPGERVAIVGPNGAGKTTMLRLFAGELLPDEGEVLIPHRTVIGYLPQEADFGAGEKTLREEVESVFEPVHLAEAELRRLEHRMAGIVDHETAEFREIAARYDHLHHEVQRLEGHAIESKMGRVLAGLGFAEWQFDRPMREFSGGWQMRALLAKLLLTNPDLMLLDEPTNHLDLESMIWLEEWIKESRSAVLMVSHERAFMDRLCHRIFELHRGAVTVYRGNYAKYLAERDQRREIEWRAYENQQREIAQVQRFIDRFRYQASKAALVQSRIKQLEKIERLEPPPSDPRTIHFRFPPAARSAKEVLCLRGVGHAYTETPVFTGVDLTLYRGDKVALVGVNGAGKSTLIKILSGKLRPRWGSREAGANTAIDHFTQGQWDTLHPGHTVLQALASAAPLESEQNLRSCLGGFCFSGEDVDKPVRVLSGGEKTRLRLAMMLFSAANCLLLDEPTNHLDVWSRMTLEAALRRYDGTLIVVSHDRYFLDAVTDKVIEISGGDVHFYPGKYGDYLRHFDHGGEPALPERAREWTEPRPLAKR
ncbi:MAG: ABC-F family ATP-binding cassette domain-containing protein, partial [Candidatus Sumerlaeia bacterium]|nr:ABC-F family ATP-binding cassette domain-containing protein [Candidatus Sumerlaeia bacterium]